MSHRLLLIGLSVRQAVGLVYLAALLGGATAIAVTTIKSENLAIFLIAASIVIALLAMIGLERLDLSDTGQVARSAEQRPLARLARQTWHRLERAS